MEAVLVVVKVLVGRSSSALIQVAGGQTGIHTGVVPVW